MSKRVTLPVVRMSSSAGVGDLLASTARAFGDRIALSCKDDALTYIELDARTNRIANLLLSLGVSPGERVAILAGNCLDYLQVILGASKAGIITACQNWRLGIRELQHCISLVEPKVIFFTDDTARSLEQLDLEGVQRIPLGAPFAERLHGMAATPPEVYVDAEDGLIILYTSGTTGLPKGALISHRAMIARAWVLQADLALPKQDHYMAWAPMFHMVSTDQSLGMLMRGSRVHVVKGLDVDEMARLIETYPMGLLPLVPGMVGSFVSELERRKVKPQKMNYVGSMADLVPRAEIEQATRFFNAPYLNTFGATETGLGPASAGSIPPGKVPDRIPKTQNSMYDVRLVDADDREVPDGTPGEVSIRGAALFSGYWNNEEANAHDFRGGRFHMGDVLRRDEHGRLEYVDRVKYMIKSGGENIYPAEIESVLTQDERVETAVVVKKPDAKWGEVPVAFIVRRDQRLSEEELRDLCAETLSRYKHPREYHFLADDQLPRSTTGKIQRHLLEQSLAEALWQSPAPEP
jgi:acyl-CoA synthetase (AMP-forming)/AMP-acid ligase II